MVFSRLRVIIPLLFCVALFSLIFDSVAFGQDLDKDPLISSHSKSFRSPQSVIFEAQRVLALVDQAELIALGEVSHSHSFWSEDSDIIETETTIALNRLVKGNAPAEIVVRSEGGFITEENIGMIAPHEASFLVGEEVMIFAHKQGAYYRIQDGTAGKIAISSFTGNGEFSLAQDSQMDLTVAELVANAAAAQYYVSTDRRWKTPESKVAFTVNVNTAQAEHDAGAFLNAITDAAATWNRTPGADFTLEYAGSTLATQTGYNQVNEVVFMSKGRSDRGALAQVWYTGDLTIVEADIWINEDFVWDTSGDLPVGKLDLQSAVLHEFGHWLILNHTEESASVMYPTLAPGVAKRQLARRDAEGISAIYPCRQAACVFGR